MQSSWAARVSLTSGRFCRPTFRLLRSSQTVAIGCLDITAMFVSTTPEMGLMMKGCSLAFLHSGTRKSFNYKSGVKPQAPTFIWLVNGVRSWLCQSTLVSPFYRTQDTSTAKYVLCMSKTTCSVAFICISFNVWHENHFRRQLLSDCLKAAACPGGSPR